MKDRFSSVAGGYAQFRPQYPPELFQWLIDQVEGRGVVWDCGTGNGQAALELAPHFGDVWATDISEAQIAQAPERANIQYRVWSAEHTEIPALTVDLITVAQAAHWFDLPAFATEVRRVAKPGARLAVWGYGLLQLPQTAQPILEHFYSQTIGPYWDAERKHIDAHYRTLQIPLAELPTPGFTIEMPSVTLEWLGGYLGTWSALKQYREQGHPNPIPAVIGELETVLGTQPFDARFPVFMRLFRV